MPMAICGYNFIYNSIPSELYNCSLVFLDESYTDRPSGSGIEFITDQIRRNAKVLYLDAMQAPPLEFGIEVVFDDPVNIFVFTQVKDWLGGEINFKQLQICAEYFNTFYWNCYITLEEDLIYNGGYRGVRATVHCDAPFAWEFQDEINYNINNQSGTIYFNNLSADSDMMRPILEFTMASNGGSFSITNVTTGKTTAFTGLSQNETITLDNELGFIISSLGLLRVKNFNKVFLKLAKGTNQLDYSAGASTMTIKFINAKRIGGGYY